MTVYLDGKRQRRIFEIDGVLQDADTGEQVERILPQLRDYQLRAVAETRAAITAESKRIVLVSPTGSGKSWIISEIIRLALEKGSVVLWLVHRRNLVTQMKETLEQFGIVPGVIMAGEESDTLRKVQIGTYQTYQRRLKFEDGRFFINADLILIDECHRSLSESYLEILKRYEGKVIIGCTATPVRADNRPMGKIYDKIVDVISVQELTDNGFLAKARYFAAPVDGLDSVKVVRGDYDVKQLDEKVNTKKLVGDIVQNWLRIAQNRPTIVFCVTVRHSVHVCEEFQKNGIPAMHLDAKSSDDERDDAFRKMESGEITVLCNVALYQEGMDCPNISCVVMARSTKSLGLYRQCCGRGLRPKTHGGDCIIMDHGGVIEEHGLLTDEVEWTLHGKDKAWKKKTPKEKKPVVCKCPACHAVFEGMKTCPDCGSELKTFGRKIEVADADLQEISGKKSFTMAEKRRFYGMLLHWIPQQKNSNPKRVAGAYKGKFGVWPKGMEDVSPIVPDMAFLNHMRYQSIKWAKSQPKRDYEPRNEIERLARTLPGI